MAALIISMQRKKLKPILVLVPHDPDRDPRIDWVTQLCSALEVRVVGTLMDVDPDQLMVEQVGTITIECVRIAPIPHFLTILASLIGFLANPRKRPCASALPASSSQRIPRLERLRESLVEE